jgi:hypothetical protein
LVREQHYCSFGGSDKTKFGLIHYFGNERDFATFFVTNHELRIVCKKDSLCSYYMFISGEGGSISRCCNKKANARLHTLRRTIYRPQLGTSHNDSLKKKGT